jgi:hypothetical protein
MNPGYRRETLQIRHAENQGTVYHPMDQQSMLLRVDVWNIEATVCVQVMERRGGNNAHRILNRSKNMMRKTKGIISVRG